MSKEIMDVYGYFFRPEKRKKDRQSVARASPPTVTTNAITHALTSPYPNTRCVRALLLLAGRCCTCALVPTPTHTPTSTHTCTQIHRGQRERHPRLGAGLAGVRLPRPLRRLYHGKDELRSIDRLREGEE